jgi:hypothetical protein
MVLSEAGRVEPFHRGRASVKGGPLTLPRSSAGHAHSEPGGGSGLLHGGHPRGSQLMAAAAVKMFGQLEAGWPKVETGVLWWRTCLQPSPALGSQSVAIKNSRHRSLRIYGSGLNWTKRKKSAECLQWVGSSGSLGFQTKGCGSAVWYNCLLIAVLHIDSIDHSKIFKINVHPRTSRRLVAIICGSLFRNTKLLLSTMARWNLHSR